MIWALAAWAGPCELAKLDTRLEASSVASDTEIVQRTAADLDAACTFEEPVQDALSAVRDGRTPDTAVLRALPAFQEACPDAAAGRSALWEACGLAPLGVATREAWEKGSGPAELALLVYAALEHPARAQVVVRRLAGVPRGQSGRVEVFEPLFPTFP